MSPVKRFLLWFMSAFYIVAGAMHFIRPDFYEPMMPPYLPFHLFLIYVSGLMEIACGVGLLLPQTRTYAAWATIALLVAIFPANIYIAVNNVPVFGAEEGAGLWNWLRLPIQGLLIGWAWLFTRPTPEDAHLLLSEFQSVFKPPLLTRLDQVMQGERQGELIRDLRDDRASTLLDIAIRYRIATESEDACLRHGWFGPVERWWKDLPPLEPIVRRALLRAGELAIKHQLPLESYWVVAGDGFRVAICKGERQISLLIISPPPTATEGLRWPPDAPDIVVLGADPKASNAATA